MCPAAHPHHLLYAARSTEAFKQAQSGKLRCTCHPFDSSTSSAGFNPNKLYNHDLILQNRKLEVCVLKDCTFELCHSLCDTEQKAGDLWKRNVFLFQYDTADSSTA